MFCLSCAKRLNDKEAAVKFKGTEHFTNPEDRYVNLCSSCLHNSDINHYDVGLDNTEEVDQEAVPLYIEGDCV